MNKIQQQYKISEAYITSERIDGQIDVRPTIIELTFFEDIEKPYITGRIAISDAAGTFDTISMSGLERLHVTIASEDSTLAPVMNRDFIMYKIDRIIKASNSGDAAVYIFDLIDEHAIIGESVKISRTVKGSLEDEITRICVHDIGKQVDQSYLTPSSQNNFKINIPYMNALEACEWLRNRATTENGMPFFLYASIHDTNLRLGNLEVMLGQPAWNVELPYIYAPANVQNAETQTPLERTMVIQSMKAASLQNTRQLNATGSIGSLYNNTNLNTGRISSTKFDVTKLLQRMQDEQIIGKNQNVYNPSFISEMGNALHELNSRVFHQVTSNGTYGIHKSYHDEIDGTRFLKKIESMAVRNLLYKNMYDVTVPGAGFIVSKASVGDIVRLDVIGDNNDPKRNQKLDQSRSGNFLIYNTRHTFRDTRHNVAMTVCKLERG